MCTLGRIGTDTQCRDPFFPVSRHRGPAQHDHGIPGDLLGTTGGTVPWQSDQCGQSEVESGSTQVGNVG